jgi:UDP-glucose 4-epimerase
MKVIVTGATGNVGTSVVRALSGDPGIDDIVAVARRTPERTLERARFIPADVSSSELVSLFDGADVVVHLAWLIQPGRDESVTARVNVGGSRRVFDAVVAAKVPALVHASSVGTYSPGPKDVPVDESWPTGGISSSFYSRHKATVERDLDQLERDVSGLRIVRMRPGLIFQRSAAAEIRRLFAGPWLPTSLLRAGLVPISPKISGLSFQAVHADDVADAYRRAVLADVSGPFNIAAEPVIGSHELAQMLKARPVTIPARLARGAASITYWLRLHPVEPGWLDLALRVPLMSVERARRELGWVPSRTSIEAVSELIAGMREGADDRTAPLSSRASGPGRVRELLTGVGQRQ